jgi:hypothetical protein
LIEGLLLTLGGKPVGSMFMVTILGLHDPWLDR